MLTTYHPAETDDGLELLAANPQTLTRFACFCVKEFSTENLLAFLLVQYIDCRATAGHDVGNEYDVFHNEFLRDKCALQVNIGSPVMAVISRQTINQQRDVRIKVLADLNANLRDTWQRYTSNKTNPDLHYPKGFRKPRTISSKDIMNAYLTVRRIAGVGPHPARQK